MTLSLEQDFPRYLAAKKTLDDRSLNRHVYGALARRLAKQPTGQTLRVLELGAGIASMPARLLEWGLSAPMHYTALDSSPSFVAQASAWLESWARQWDYALQRQSETRFTLSRNYQRLSLELVQEDLFAFLGHAPQAGWDLLVAHAFLDLVDLDETLPRLLGLLAPGGAFYFTLNFDGVTVFEPLIDPALDAKITALYHRNMDERRVDGRQAGHSQTGRRLFAALQQAGAQVLAAGSSDWVVYPAEGGYPGDENLFLQFILQFVEDSLSGHPELDAGQFAAWLVQRRRQVDEGRLVFIAHQVDLLGTI